MRPLRFLVCLGLMLSTRAVRAGEPAPATQPSESQVIDVSDKAAIDAAMNKEVVVEGVVESSAWSSSGKVLSIRFKNSKETNFSAVVFDKHKADFDSAFSGDIAKALPGAKVRVRGLVKEYRTHPEIVIDSPAQITIVEPPPTSQPAKEDPK